MADIPPDQDYSVVDASMISIPPAPVSPFMARAAEVDTYALKGGGERLVVPKTRDTCEDETGAYHVMSSSPPPPHPSDSYEGGAYDEGPVYHSATLYSKTPSPSARTTQATVTGNISRQKEH